MIDVTTKDEALWREEISQILIEIHDAVISHVLSGRPFPGNPTREMAIMMLAAAAVMMGHEYFGCLIAFGTTPANKKIFDTYVSDVLNSIPKIKP